jgi:hypothetical protein
MKSPAASAGALLLGLVNVRVALRCFAVTLDSPHAGSECFAAPEIREELGADLGQLRSDFERLLQQAEALLVEVEKPARMARAAQRRAWARRLAPPLLLALVLGLVGWGALRAPEVSLGKPWKTSSTAMVCDPVHETCGGTKTRIFFHTTEEAEPWFEIDLGREYALSRIEVQNRSDCCADRALPLIVEVSVDHRQYRAVARKFAAFAVWKQALSSSRARYVRLRVARRSALHLEQVRIFGRPG